jgi:integrase
MAMQDDAHGKRCASVRFPGVDSAAMSLPTGPRPSRKIPKLGRHSSGQARVTLDGKVHYCGPWGTAAAHARYLELVRAWQDRGEVPAARAPNPAQARVRLGDLLRSFLDHVDATGRYRKNGEPTTQRAEFVNVIDSLTAFAGKVPVVRMTEATLVAWRDQLERNRVLTRTGINRKVGKVVQMLRWGRARGLVPKVVWADVSAIEPLRRGEVGDRPEHGRPRRAVTLDEVEQVAAHCAPQVGDMLRVQALCGMRPGEILQMRWSDISKEPLEGDTTGAWLYVVPSAKTRHHGHVTRYVLPRASQEILARYPAVPLAHIFSPAAAMAERRERRRAARRSKLTPSQRQRDQNAKRDYADTWDTHEYRRHVTRACEKAGVQTFTPHEVRHGFVTWAANALSLGAAAAAANHRSVTTTQRYVHVKATDAITVAAAVQARMEARASG